MRFFVIFYMISKLSLALGLDSAKNWIWIRIHDTTVFLYLIYFIFMQFLFFCTYTQAESVRWRRVRPGWLQQHTATQQKERTPLPTRDGILKLLRSQGIDSSSLCSSGGPVRQPIPTRFLALLDCSKIPVCWNICDFRGGISNYGPIGVGLLDFTSVHSFPASKKQAQASFINPLYNSTPVNESRFRMSSL